MEKKSEVKKPDTTAGDAGKIPDFAELHKKWGVSYDEIEMAIAKVGNDRSSIEEYLLNNKWQRKDIEQPSFQKRRLDEDETY